MNPRIEILFGIAPWQKTGDIFNLWKDYFSIGKLYLTAGDEFTLDKIKVNFFELFSCFGLYNDLVLVVFFQ